MAQLLTIDNTYISNNFNKAYAQKFNFMTYILSIVNLVVL